MKYILLFVSDRDDQAKFDKLHEAEKMKIYGPIMDWFGDKRIVGGEELQPVATASTVRKKNGKATVTDGPHADSNEFLGGYAVAEVKDKAEAIALAKTWPGMGNSIVEVRPLVDHSAD